MSTENGGGKQYCILFYKYHPLTDNPEILETYRQGTETLCASLELTGRILIGLSNDEEGINGTLAGTKDDLDAYVDCMLGRDVATAHHDQRKADAVIAFREASKKFFAKLDRPELFFGSPNDFKWSSWSMSSSAGNNSNSIGDIKDCFPDLNIKIVKEIISSGGAFAGISTTDTSVGYLTPKEWHEEIKSLTEKKKKEKNSGSDGNVQCKEGDIDTILIDVRNHKECQIGSFAPGISIDPQTKTFAQFPKWVKENSAESETSKDTSAAPSPSMLKNKRILMYCTGGIRCEKASAYIRQVVPENKGIYHLKGGIHKYLEEFGQEESTPSSIKKGDVDGNNKGSEGGECLFVGKNFVFDRRGALDAKGHGIEKDMDPYQIKPNSVIIGECQYCSSPYDVFHPENVCTVCREPILVCEKCQFNLCQKQRSLRGLASSAMSGVGGEDESEKESNYRAEYHCQDHFHLNMCYFTSLYGFERYELVKQMEQLQLHSEQLEGVGKKGKQKRRTLRKQINKIEACMKDNDKGKITGLEPAMQCRHCGSSACKADCWGFHGGNTRMVNKNKKNQNGDDKGCANTVDLKKHKQRTRVPSNQRPAKRRKRQNDISEIEALQLCNPPSQYRSDATGLRVPPPIVRILRSGVKGRWTGKTVHWVLNNEFGDWHSLPQEERDERLEKLISAGLIRINGISITKMLESSASSPSPHPAKASDIVLRNMDTIERIVHWHEPPISVPSKISLTKHILPDSILSSNGESTSSPFLYCINKPSSVPIYPAGPYYANSLLLMVEAQERLPPKSLIPLHRIDRATSGVLLCANMSSVARVVQGRMTSSFNDDENCAPVRKLYLARVSGRFPCTPSESPSIPKECEKIASIAWCGNEKNVIEINAPVDVQLSTSMSSGNNEGENPPNAMMHRTVGGGGKKSISRFKFISYDPNTNQSLISCCPITGRGHQLRVHLELIGYPIHNDAEYGGTVVEDNRKEQERLSAQSMLDITTATTECRHDKAVTVDEAKSAVRLCRCCCGGLGGIKDCFTSGQLLGCGHAIDLHAYKYCISFKPNKKKEGMPHDIGCKTEYVDKGTTSMEFKAVLPSWAALFAGLTLNDCLTWLN